MSFTCISESERRLTASSIYSRPLRPWETRVLRLDPVQSEHAEAEIVDVRLETAVIPHSEGFGLVDTGEVVFYEALSYTWDSNIFSHSIRCNGLDFSVTANLHAALVHLRTSRMHRWLWIDALCINQYDNFEKERQILNMFHIYRKASTVLVWLGPAGPNTTLGADILNVYDELWQTRDPNIDDPMRDVLERNILRDSDSKIYVDQFLNNLQKRRFADDGRYDTDTLGLLSMALDGITDILGRAWIRRTWIIQEFTAASHIEFHCGPSILSYDAFFSLIPDVVRTIWSTRNVFLEGKEESMYADRLNREPASISFPDLPGQEIPPDGPACLKQSIPFTEALHRLRLLVSDPARNVGIRRTQVEVLLVLLTETISQSFEVSIAADRLYSLIAMADSISCATLSVTHHKRKTSSPQRLPVDYSVNIRDAVLRALKIRMNEIGYFYVAITEAKFLTFHEVKKSTEQETKSALLSMFKGHSSVPSWLKLLEFDEGYLRGYVWSVYCKQDQEGDPRCHEIGRKYRYPFWVEQDVMEPDTLVVRGKMLGRLVVDYEERPSRVRMTLPCPLGQELDRHNPLEEPIWDVHLGCPDERDAAENADPLVRDKISDLWGWKFSGFWKWQFTPDVRDGDVVIVIHGTVALVRPVPGNKYKVVKDGLIVYAIGDGDSRHAGKWVDPFLARHSEDLDTFIFI